MLLHQIHLKNLLSFGPDSKPLELRSLNVLIGPNGSGKSNLIDAISLLQAAASDLMLPFRNGGGGTEWIWKGANPRTGEVSVVVRNEVFDLAHTMQFAARDRYFGLVLEQIGLWPLDAAKQTTLRQDLLTGPLLSNGVTDICGIPFEKLKHNQSLVSQASHNKSFEYAADLREGYQSIHIYRDWTFGRSAPLRQLARADEPGATVAPDYANLAGVLGRATSEPLVKRAMLERLDALCSGITDIVVSPVAGFLELVLHIDNFRISAARLSDGTLRYLCLLAILCDPKPPPLICIEEPELGLHPDLIPKIAELLKEASERTQLIVTTHSSMLVDCFNAMPEVIVVCEKVDGQTQMNRLDPEELAVWLEKYRLADLWSSGLIGGNRW